MKKTIYLAMIIGLVGSAIICVEQREPDPDFEKEVLKPLDEIVKKVAQQNLDMATKLMKYTQYDGFVMDDREGNNIPINSTKGLKVIHDMIAIAYLMEKYPRGFALGNFDSFRHDAPHWYEVDKTKERLKELNREATPENMASAAALRHKFVADYIQESKGDRRDLHLRFLDDDTKRSKSQPIHKYKSWVNPEQNRIQRAFNILYASYAEKHPNKIAQKGDRNFISDQKRTAGFALFKKEFPDVPYNELIKLDLLNDFDSRWALERLFEGGLLHQEELDVVNALADRIMQGEPAPKIAKESLRPFFSPVEVEKPSMFQSFVNSIKDWFSQQKEAFKTTDWQQKLQLAREQTRQSIRQAGQRTSASLQRTAARIAEPSPEAKSSFGSTIEGEGSGRVQRYEIVPGSPADRMRQWWNKKR